VGAGIGMTSSVFRLDRGGWVVWMDGWMDRSGFNIANPIAPASEGETAGTAFE
jgi:hypothetical protein